MAKKNRKIKRGGDGDQIITKNMPTAKDKPIPMAKDGIPVLSNTALQWFKITDWLRLSKMFFIVGVIIFSIASISPSKGGMMAAYSWMTSGVIISIFLVLLIVSTKDGGNKKFLSIIKAIMPLILPGLFLLAPLIGLIYIFYVTGGIIDKDASHLPSIFNKINIAAFFCITIQAYILSKFYASEIEAFKTGSQNPKKWTYISGMILTSILTGAMCVELFVIITSFLTDG
jgi:hypothetical protein